MPAALFRKANQGHDDSADSLGVPHAGRPRIGRTREDFFVGELDSSYAVRQMRMSFRPLVRLLGKPVSGNSSKSTLQDIMSISMQKQQDGR